MNEFMKSQEESLWLLWNGTFLVAAYPNSGMGWGLWSSKKNFQLKASHLLPFAPLFQLLWDLLLASRWYHCCWRFPLRHPVHSHCAQRETCDGFLPFLPLGGDVFCVLLVHTFIANAQLPFVSGPHSASAAWHEFFKELSKNRWRFQDFCT